MELLFNLSFVNILSAVVPICVIIYSVLDRLPPSWRFSEKSYLIGQKSPVNVTSLECPYAYLRAIYGHYHWAPFVRKIAPTLKADDPGKYKMVLEIMDTIHLCLMLVDDISDGSSYRKGRPAAHKIYGPSETANRAYFRVTQILTQTTLEYPSLAPFLMCNLSEILEGQDKSLVWRRDGLAAFPSLPNERVAAYRHMASLKTGALFRLLGQLVLEDRSLDDTLTLVAWHSQLQNDCKNLYSSEYAQLKGAGAEDLRNQELTYPIVLALDAPFGDRVAKALESPSPHNVRRALNVIRCDSVREQCMAELQRSGATIQGWLALWGRKEKLDLKA